MHALLVCAFTIPYAPMMFSGSVIRVKSQVVELGMLNVIYATPGFRRPRLMRTSVNPARTARKDFTLLSSL